MHLRTRGLLYVIGCLALALVCSTSNRTHAQIITNITPDTTLPTNSVIQPNGNVFEITAGTSVGGNLFHSFQDFHVGSGDVASFVDPGGIANILSRVTGANPSNIFGQLRSDSSANVFFLNPNGVVFGPNSSIDVGGSFHVSTANELRLGSGDGKGMFNASAHSEDILTSAPPAAFGFLPNSSSPISIDGLQLSASTSTVLASDITIGRADGGVGVIRAVRGQANIVSVLSPDEVLLTPTSDGFSINTDSGNTFSRVSFQGGIEIDSSSVDSGRVVVQGRNLMLNTGAFINATTLGSTQGSTFELRASEDIIIDGATIIANTEGIGDGGNVVLFANNNVAILNGSQIDATNFSDSFASGGSIELTSARIVIDESEIRVGSLSTFGNSGDVFIDASEGVTLDNASIFASSFLGAGTAGTVNIRTASVIFRGVSIIDTSTRDRGNGGSVNFQALDRLDLRSGGLGSVGINSGSAGAGAGGEINFSAPVVTLDEGISLESQSIGSGKSGNINIQAEQVNIINGSRVNVSSILGGGGNIVIRGHEGVLIAGEGTSLASRTSGGANGGNILIEGDNLMLTDGAELSTVTAGVGNAGNINIDGAKFVVQKGANITTGTSSSGRGGLVSIEVDNFVLTGSGTSISADTSLTTNSPSSMNNGGDITITAETIAIENGAIISASTSGTGSGGTVSVAGSETLTVSGLGSGVFTTTSDVGAAGDIWLVGQSIALTDEGRISAESTGTGNAGTLTVGDAMTQTVRLENGIIRATADSASGGNIKIDATQLIQVTNSTIETSVRGNATTAGGNINVDPDAIVLQNSQLLATATAGFGGNIDLIGNVVLVDPASTINASSDFGVSGSVNIQAPIQNLSGTIAPLPETIIQTATLYAAQCAAQKNGAFSSLSVRGRDRLPFEPGDYLGTPLLVSQASPSLSGSTTSRSSLMAHRLALPKSIIPSSIKSRPLEYDSFPFILFRNGCHS